MPTTSVTPNKEYAVLVISMTYTDEPGGDLHVRGFPSFDAAREYARRRTRDSLEELRTSRGSPDELRKLWLIYGEDVLVMGGEGEEAYSGANELDFFIAHPATALERDWQGHARQFSLSHER